ncbi:MAG: GTPase ObgE [Spirochaetes bacterium]|nr:MAG: GTPase ObgE [Spirochaetota bacterium]
MHGFADETFIDVTSGNGGHGCVSFRREKYVPKGGPDGGDGGKGGDVIFVVRDNLKTLSHLKTKRVYRAENGRPGEGRRKHGRNGKDAVIAVPPGTLVKDPESGEVIKDLTGLESWVFLKGGQGGLGNWHFSTSRKQTPRYAQSGKSGEDRRVHVELQLIADIGLVGLPNAGKSSMLKALTNAQPKVAAYPFTTKIPNLGVMTGTYKKVVIADIPGIIEGASSGSGMGIKFLKHINRTKAIAFIIDLTEKDPVAVYRTLIQELKEYAPDLAHRKRIIVGTKNDLPGSEAGYTALKKAIKDGINVSISSFSRSGLDELTKYFEKITE